MGRSIDNPWKARSTWTLQSVQLRQVKQWEVIPNCTLSKDVKSEQRWGWCSRCIVYVCQTKSLLALLWVWAALGVKLEVQTCTACFGTKVLGSRHVEGAPNGNLQQKVAGRTMQLCCSLRCFVHVLKHDFGIFCRWSRVFFPTWNRYQHDPSTFDWLKSRALFSERLALDSAVVSWELRQAARCQVWHSSA